MKRAIFGVICASALVGAAVGGVGCDDDDVFDDGPADTAYYDSYLYYGYYPADVYYSSYYWASPGFYYYAQYNPGGSGTGSAGSSGTGTAGSSGTGTGGSGGTTTASGDMTIGDILRAMARGESVCPNQVTITPKMTPNACATDGSGMSRGGVTLVFNGCQLANGSRFDGTIDVSSTRTLSDPACGPGTNVTFMSMTTITNLTRTTVNGSKILIPNSSGSITASYVAGSQPASIAMTMDGALQVVGIGGNVNANRTFSADLTVTPSSNRSSYTVDGVTTVQDPNDPGTTTLTSSGMLRSDTCCRPTGGTLSINRSSGTNAGTHTWTFGPSCGAILFDGVSFTAPACL